MNVSCMAKNGWDKSWVPSYSDECNPVLENSMWDGGSKVSAESGGLGLEASRKGGILGPLVLNSE